MKFFSRNLSDSLLVLLFLCGIISALFMSPANARFISPDTVDPTTQGVGTNRYAYAENDPVNKSDPSGRIADTVWDLANIGYDLGVIGYGYFVDDVDTMNNGWIDLGVDSAAAVIPGLPAGASKIGRALKNVDKVAKPADDAKKVAKTASNAPDAVKAKEATSVDKKAPHGNTLDNRPATRYEKYDKDGNFRKHGITKHEDPSKRYSKKDINGGEVRAVERGPRSDMAKNERDQVEANPGPDNKEPWAGSRQGE